MLTRLLQLTMAASLIAPLLRARLTYPTVKSLPGNKKVVITMDDHLKDHHILIPDHQTLDRILDSSIFCCPSVHSLWTPSVQVLFSCCKIRRTFLSAKSSHVWPVKDRCNCGKFETNHRGMWMKCTLQSIDQRRWLLK